MKTFLPVVILVLVCSVAKSQQFPFILLADSLTKRSDTAQLPSTASTSIASLPVTATLAASSLQNSQNLKPQIFNSGFIDFKTAVK